MAMLVSSVVEGAAWALRVVVRMPDHRPVGIVTPRGLHSLGPEDKCTWRAVHFGSTVSASQAPRIPLKHRVSLFLVLIRPNKGKQGSLIDRHMVIWQTIEPGSSDYERAVVHQVVHRLF